MALCELVTDLPRPRFLGLKAIPLDVALNPIEFTYEGVELLVVLMEGGITGKDARLALALVLFFLVRGLLVPSPIVILWRCCHEIDPFSHIVAVRVGLSRAVARVFLDKVGDRCWLVVDDDHEC